MQNLHRYAGFLSLPCPVLHRIALPVVSKWCQHFRCRRDEIGPVRIRRNEEGGEARSVLGT